MINKKGLLNVAKGYIKGKVKLHEESKATKKGLELMKELGASKEEMKIARKNLKDMENSYRSGSKLSYLYPLKNTISK
jgi:5-bromo-4-chloroindolyl phosphate hydrolysis protein